MTDFKLYDNGIRAVHKKIGDSKTFSIMIYVMAGAANDPKGQDGIAHYAEHMFFKSTKSRSTKQIIFDLDSMGTSSNAATTRESTRFYLTTTTQFVEKAFDILTDCLKNPLYNENEMATEKKVVCSEIDMYDDDKMDCAYVNSVAQFFKKDFSMAHPVIGCKETVNAITRQNLIDFHEKFYTPGRIIVSTAGGVDFELVDEYIQKYLLPKFPKKEKPLSYKMQNQVFAPKTDGETLVKDTEQFYLFAVSNGFAQNVHDTLLIDLGSKIMGESMSSRLFQAVREERGLVYGIGTGHVGESFYGFSILEMACNYENAKEALSVIKDEFKKLKAHGFSKEELELAKTKKITNLILSNERSSNLVYIMASNLAYCDNLFDLDYEINEINAVTLDELNKFTTTYLSNMSYYATAVANKNDLKFMEILKD